MSEVRVVGPWKVLLVTSAAAIGLILLVSMVIYGIVELSEILLGG
ncbi:MAG: hypothetical protein ABDH61_05685 [Acidilobaceae archaeon]